MHLTPEQLSTIQALYDVGKPVSAYRLGIAHAPIKEWRGAGARVLAGRLAFNLGAPKFGRAVHRLAYREHPADAEVLYYASRELLDRRGPLPAWRFLLREGDLADAPVGKKKQGRESLNKTPDPFELSH